MSFLVLRLKTSRYWPVLVPTSSHFLLGQLAFAEVAPASLHFALTQGVVDSLDLVCTSFSVQVESLMRQNQEYVARSRSESKRLLPSRRQKRRRPSSRRAKRQSSRTSRATPVFGKVVFQIGRSARAALILRSQCAERKSSVVLSQTPCTNATQTVETRQYTSTDAKISVLTSSPSRRRSPPHRAPAYRRFLLGSRAAPADITDTRV